MAQDSALKVVQIEAAPVSEHDGYFDKLVGIGRSNEGGSGEGGAFAAGQGNFGWLCHLGSSGWLEIEVV